MGEGVHETLGGSVSRYTTAQVDVSSKKKKKKLCEKKKKQDKYSYKYDVTRTWYWFIIVYHVCIPGINIITGTAAVCSEDSFDLTDEFFFFFQSNQHNNKKVGDLDCWWCVRRPGVYVLAFVFVHCKHDCCCLYSSSRHTRVRTYVHTYIPFFGISCGLYRYFGGPSHESRINTRIRVRISLESSTPPPFSATYVVWPLPFSFSRSLPNRSIHGSIHPFHFRFHSFWLTDYICFSFFFPTRSMIGEPHVGA